MAVRAVFGGEGDGVRHRASQPEPGQEAPVEEARQRVGGDREQGEDGEGEGTQDDHGLTSHPVGYGAEDQRAEHQAE